MKSLAVRAPEGRGILWPNEYDGSDSKWHFGVCISRFNLLL